MNETQILTTIQESQRDAFVDRLLQAMSGVFDIFTVHIGSELGLYRALADGDRLASVELAGRSGTQVGMSPAGRFAQKALTEQRNTSPSHHSSRNILFGNILFGEIQAARQIGNFVPTRVYFK